MKFNIILVLMLITHIALSQPSNKLDSMGRRTGLWKIYNRDSSFVKDSGNYSEGKKIGLWTYHANLDKVIYYKDSGYVIVINPSTSIYTSPDSSLIHYYRLDTFLHIECVRDVANNYKCKKMYPNNRYVFVYVAKSFDLALKTVSQNLENKENYWYDTKRNKRVKKGNKIR
jgi:hypothetical protein